MPEISLTDFVDFVIKSGTPKLTKVRSIKNRGKYNPAFDFWRRMRGGIQEWHRTGSSDKSQLNALVELCPDLKKIGRYHAALRGYKKFLGRKRLAWFDPPSQDWTYRALTVRVNPELGLKIDGKPCLIKLYFKDEPLSKLRVDAVIDLMNMSLLTQAPRGCTSAVLDVSSGKIFAGSATQADSEILLKGEAVAFAEMWNAVQ